MYCVYSTAWRCWVMSIDLHDLAWVLLTNGETGTYEISYAHQLPPNAKHEKGAFNHQWYIAKAVEAHWTRMSIVIDHYFCMIDDTKKVKRYKLLTRPIRKQSDMLLQA